MINALKLRPVRLALALGVCGLLVAAGAQRARAEQGCVIGPGAQCQGADLHFHTFEDLQDLRGADFTRANLRGATMIRVKLQFGTLTAADLVGANLTRAGVLNITAERSDFRDATLDQTFLSGDFRRSDFSLAHGKDTVLDGAGLEWATLRGAQFAGAHMRGVQLAYADLTDANFKDAKTRGYTHTFDKAILCRTTLPDGSVSNRDCVGAGRRRSTRKPQLAG